MNVDHAHVSSWWAALWTDKEKMHRQNRFVVVWRGVWCDWILSATVARERTTRLVQPLLFSLGPADIYTCKYTKCVCLYRCGRNSELIINKNNILLKAIDTNFSMSQFTVALNFFFYILSLFVYNVF